MARSYPHALQKSQKKDGGFGILSDESEGYIACARKDCGWEVRGGTKPKEGSSVRWVSINDIISGKYNPFSP